MSIEVPDHPLAGQLSALPLVTEGGGGHNQLFRSDNILPDADGEEPPAQLWDSEFSGHQHKTFRADGTRK